MRKFSTLNSKIYANTATVELRFKYKLFLEAPIYV